MTFRVFTPADGVHDVRIVFNDINSVMRGYVEGDHFRFDNIPRNQDITVVALRFKSGKPALAMIKTNTSNLQVKDPTYTEVASLDELKQKLSVLNN